MAEFLHPEEGEGHCLAPHEGGIREPVQNLQVGRMFNLKFETLGQGCHYPDYPGAVVWQAGNGICAFVTCNPSVRFDLVEINRGRPVLNICVPLQRNFQDTVEYMCAPFLAGCRRMRQFASEHHLTDRPHTMLWLTKAYALPTSMYACQIWGTRFMKEGVEMDCPLQTVHMCLLKRILG
eukprot:256047-Pelagomonas_calceolata.AAC.1